MSEQIFPNDVVWDERRIKMWNCWGCGHLERTCRLYFAWRIVFEKALRKMGAVHAHSRLKTHSGGKYEQCLEHFYKNETDFVCQFIAMDEMHIRHYISESKHQSNYRQKLAVRSQRKQIWSHQVGRSLSRCFGMLQHFVNRLPRKG